MAVWHSGAGPASEEMEGESSSWGLYAGDVLYSGLYKLLQIAIGYKVILLFIHFTLLFSYSPTMSEG